MLYNGNGEMITFLENVRPPFKGFLDISYSKFSSYAPANTKANFETAGFFGFDAIKCDVRISADNVLILCHDAGFTFDTDGRISQTHDSSNETLIRDMQSADILALEYAQFNMGEKPCTFDDYCQICAKWDKIPFVTVRDEYMDIIAPLVVDALRRWNLSHKAIINSFTVESLEAIRALDASIWLNIVMGTALKASDIETAERLYPCALSPYLSGTTTATEEELAAFYEPMADLVAECQNKMIPVMTAGTYLRRHYNFFRSHYNGTQVNNVVDFFPRKKLFVCVKYSGGVWEFSNYYGFESSGTITENNGVLSIVCDQIVPTWLLYLNPTISAKCTTDSSVSVSAVYGGFTAPLKVTPSSIAEGMKLVITVDF